MTGHTLALTEADYADLALDVLAPPAGDSLWDWCCNEMVMPDGSAFDPRRAGIMRHWYDVVGARISGRPLEHDPWAHRCEEAWLVLAGQIAKTTLANAACCWTTAHHPRPIGFYMKRGDDLKENQKTKVQPIIEQTPSLAKLLPRGADARERAFGQKLYQIGGTDWYWRKGDVAADWRTIALALEIMDEFDVYPEDVEGEGDPIDLGLVRMRTFWATRLALGTTTPTTITRHGWRRLCSGSHERPLVLCRECGATDWLNPRQIVVSGGRRLDEVSADEIAEERLGRWACRWCGCLHDDQAMRLMILEATEAQRWVAGVWSNDDEHPAGIWQPTASLTADGRIKELYPPETVVRSGQAGALWSIDVSLSDFAAGKARRLRQTEQNRKSWCNTEEAEPWVPIITGTSVEEISDQAKASYALGTCPVDAPYLVLSCDQQGNHRQRFWWAWVLRAFVDGGESWMVACGKAQGFGKLGELEDRLWPIGRQQRAADFIVMDSANPNFRHDGYLWAADDTSRRILLRGDARLAGHETWIEDDGGRSGNRRRRTSKPSNVTEYRIHPHHWRTILQDRMLGHSDEPPWHIPADSPDYYLKSLNAEEQTVELRRVRGGYEEVVVWVGRETSRTDKTVNRRKDIHWADAEKMACAFANIMGWDQVAVPDTTPQVPRGTEEPAGFDDMIDEFISDDWGEM